MNYSFYIKSAYLKVVSGLLTNISAGLFFLPFTLTDTRVLTMSIILAIVCIVFSIKIEEVLEEL